MERGDQITIRKELNPLGVVLTAILAGDLLYSPMAVGAAMLAVGLTPPSLFVVAAIAGPLHGCLPQDIAMCFPRVSFTMNTTVY